MDDIKSIVKPEKPYNLVETLKGLIDAADILLHKKNYDGHNWEELEQCYTHGKDFIEIIVQALRNDYFKTMDIKIKKLTPTAKMPIYSTDGAAGMDLFVDSVDNLENGEVKFNFGLALEIPKGFCALILPRSSVYKLGLILSNSVGLIDSDYRGGISAIFYNFSLTTPPVSVGDRVAQLVIIPHPKINFMEVEELGETKRGIGGYGSTGK